MHACLSNDLSADLPPLRLFWGDAVVFSFMTIGRSTAIINMTSVCLSTTVYDRQDLHKEEMQTVGEGDGLDQSLGELFHYADLQAVSTRR